MNVRKQVSRASRLLVGLTVFLLVSYAVLVVIGRQLLPHLDRYQAEINVFLSKQLGVPVSAAHIEGTWTRLTPRLSAQGLRIGDPDAQHVSLERLSLELDLLGSIASGGLVWRNLTFGGIALTLSEGADGHWSAAGLPAVSDNGGGIETLVGNLLLSKFIGIDEVRATLELYSGVVAQVSLRDIRLENTDEFHRLTADLAMDDNPHSARLVVESTGSVVDLEGFRGEGYLRLNRINFRGSVSAILSSWFPDLVTQLGEIDTELEAEFWLRLADRGKLTLEGQVRASEIPLSWAADLPPVKNLSTDVTGWFNVGESWGMRWQQLDFDWSDVAIQPLDLQFSQRLGADWRQLSLAMSQLNLTTLTRVLTETGLASGKTREVVATLQPRGQLRNLHLQLDLQQAFPLTALQVHIDHLDVQSWHGAPATRNLSGNLFWEGQSGFFELDSPDGFAMHYPGTYRDYMEHGRSRGRVNLFWQPSESAVEISGGPIQISGDEGEISAYLALDLPFGSDRAAEMWLLAGIRDSHSRQSGQYIPQVLDPALRTWLQNAIGDMDIVEGGFIWRGPLSGNAAASASIQVYAKVANGEVDYDPGWPKLTDMSAYITVNNGQLRGVVGPARVGGAELRRAEVATQSSKNGLLLTIDGAVTTPLDKGAAVLQSSPLAARVAMLESWQLAGRAEVDLDLAIPLIGTIPGAHYGVVAIVEDGRMDHREVDIAFEKIRGKLTYDEVNGLSSSGIKGQFWGQPVNAVIATEAGSIQIRSQGRIDTAKLPIFDPFVQARVVGSSDYQAQFTVPETGLASLQFSSTMEGIRFAFPAPLDKPSIAPWPLAVNINFGEAIDVRAQFAEHLAASFVISEFEFAGGNIALDGRLPSAASPVGLMITGHTPLFNLDEWLATLGAAELQGSGDLAALEPRFKVTVGEGQFKDYRLNNVELSGSFDSAGWDFYIDSGVLAGRVKVPADTTQPLWARMNYIALPEPERDAETDVAQGGGFLDNIVPGELPHLDLVTEGFSIGKHEYGNLGFLMKPQGNGVGITNIRGEIIGIAIDKLPDGDAASLHWYTENGTHHSKFSALLKTYDLGAVLKAWRLPMVLNSKEAVSIVELAWEDKPWAMRADQLTGHAALNFKDGLFFQAPGTTTNAFIKIIGLINFDSWLRRLRLDFSDFFSSGVAYDSLKGGLRFRENLMAFDEPIVVDLPSGKMRLLGNADLRAESIDARLVATLPVGTNLPWIAALVGGLPAAAGVYLTSKLFEKEVDKVSSISYQVKGPWGEPEVAVDRIFSDKTGG